MSTAPLSTARVPVPLPHSTTQADGTLVCVWENGVSVQAALGQRTKCGRYPVKVLCGAQQVGSGIVDVTDLNDRQRLNAECIHLDGQIGDYLGYLMRASDVITELQHAGATKRLQVVPLSTVTPERVHWLWKPYLPLGRPVALEGDPGIGKSSLVAKIITHLTSGQPFPNVLEEQTPQPLPACTVCLLTGEDAPGDTILPRIAANGGDPARVYLLEGWVQPDGAQGIVTMQDLDLLTAALEQYQPRLVVFDPLQSFFGRGIDMNQVSDTRPVLDAVAALFQRYACTPLFVRHIGKSRREALYAGLGSIDITGRMRSVLFVGQDPDNAQRRILAHSKANNARLGPSLAYTITSIDYDLWTPTGDRVTVEAPCLAWDGLSPLTANDLANCPASHDEAPGALEQAKEFLAVLLAQGPVLYNEVYKAMQQAGIAMATLKRAKPLVGVKARRRPGEEKNGPWEWYLPGVGATP